MEGSNQASQTQHTINPTPPAINSGKSKLIPITLGVAAVAIIAIGAYLLGTKQSQPPFQSQKECESKTGKKCSLNMCQESVGSPQPIGWCKTGFYPFENQSATRTIQPTGSAKTANWKTYRNERYEFEYPNNWSLNEGVNYQFLYDDPNYKGSFWNYTGAVRIYEDKPSYAISGSKGTEKVVDGIGIQIIDTTLLEDKQTTIYKTKVDKSSKTGLSSGYAAHVSLPLQKEHLFIDIHTTEANDQEYKKIFDHIISSFKFIDKIQIIDHSDSNWKTYRFTDYAIEFQYSSEAHVSDYGIQKYGITIEYIEKLPPGAPDGYEQGPGYSIHLQKISSGDPDLKTYILKEIEDGKKDGSITKPLSTVTISGITAYTYSYVIEIERTKIFIPYKSENSFLEIYYSYNDQNKKGHRQTIDQILSTFKFTNVGTSGTPVPVTYKPASNWHTVNNTTLGLNFCLPPKWDFSKNGDGTLSGNLIFYRDAGYTPKVAFIENIPYSGGSHREAYFKHWESELPSIRESVSIKDTDINGNIVLTIASKTPPGGDLKVVWHSNGKLWEAGLSDWQSVNPSQTAFLKDFYTAISCSL